MCSEVVAKTPGNRCGRILDCIEVRVESYPKTKIGRNQSETDVPRLETYRIITLQTGEILKVQREFPHRERDRVCTNSEQTGDGFGDFSRIDIRFCHSILLWLHLASGCRRIPHLNQGLVALVADF